MQGATRVAEQAAGDRVIAGSQIGIDHLAQPRRNVFPLFNHQHAIENFPFDGAFRAVDDAEGILARRHCQHIRLTVAGVNIDHGFSAGIGRALFCGDLRGVIEQPACGNHQDHRTGDSQLQDTGRPGVLGRPWGTDRHGCPYSFVTEDVFGCRVLPDAGVCGMKNSSSAPIR